MPIFQVEMERRRPQLHGLRRRRHPVGAYNPNRLSNIGIGHGAIDAGGGYTYFNPANRPRNFLACGGFTYNFKNPETQYQKRRRSCTSTGVHRSFCRRRSWLASWAMSTRSSTDDSGQATVVGGFRSRVLRHRAPNRVYCFRSATCRAIWALRAYGEFARENRPCRLEYLDDVCDLGGGAQDGELRAGASRNNCERPARHGSIARCCGCRSRRHDADAEGNRRCRRWPEKQRLRVHQFGIDDDLLSSAPMASRPFPIAYADIAAIIFIKTAHRSTVAGAEAPA